MIRPTNIVRYSTDLKCSSACVQIAPQLHTYDDGKLITFSDAVAIIVPTKFSDIQLSGASCAAMSRGAFSVFAKSTMCTWPLLQPGKANKELLLFGHKTHSPGNKIKVLMDSARQISLIVY